LKTLAGLIGAISVLFVATASAATPQEEAIRVGRGAPVLKDLPHIRTTGLLTDELLARFPAWGRFD
jgi:hypothetical protein